MGQTLPIAAPAETGGAHPFDANPGSAPDSALFAMLMAQAGWPFAGGLVAGVTPEIMAEGEAAPTTPPEDFAVGKSPIAPEAIVDSEESADGTRNVDLEANARPIENSEVRREWLNRGRILPDAAVAPLGAPRVDGANSDGVGLKRDFSFDLDLEKGIESEPLPDVGADPDKGAEDRVPRPDRPTNPTAELRPSPKPVRLSELDLEGFGVKRIEVKVEHVSPKESSRNVSADAPRDSRAIEQAAPRTVGMFTGPVGEAVPIETFRPRSDHSRAPERGPGVRDQGNVPLEMSVGDHVDTGTQDFTPDGRMSEFEWNSVVTTRSKRTSDGESRTAADAGSDLGGAPPDAARPTGDFRAEFREGSAISTDRRVLAPQPPKPIDPHTFAPEPVRRVLMTVGDAENEVHVLVHESKGDVSVRIDAPHAIRAHLEASAHQLVESMSREQVALMSMTFSGPSHGKDAHSNARHFTRPGSRRGAGVSSASEDSVSTGSGLHFAESGSRIHIRV